MLPTLNSLTHVGLFAEENFSPVLQKRNSRKQSREERGLEKEGGCEKKNSGTATLVMDIAQISSSKNGDNPNPGTRPTKKRRESFLPQPAR